MGRPPRGSERGADVEVPMRISFMEAVHGCTKTIELRLQAACSPCDGSGLKSGSKLATCKTCGGTGTISKTSGYFHIQNTCPSCQGQGTSGVNCPSCTGNGLVNEKKKVDIKIPAGVDDSVHVRVPNQGNAGPNGGKRGHIFVRVLVEPSPIFKREGNDVHVTVPLAVTEAILGGTVSVPTLDGTEVRLKISPGTQPTDRHVMRGKGVKYVGRSGQGDQYVHFTIDIPRTLSSKEKTLIEEWAKLKAGDSSGSGGSSGGGSDPSGTSNTTTDDKDKEKKKGIFGKIFN